MSKKQKIKYVISACLLGIPCRWDKKAKLNKKALKFFLQGKAIALCPEVMAGLPTPRPACEIIGGDGEAVLKGKGKVIDKHGKDYSKIFIKGAYSALDSVKKHKIKKAILKSGSPSCGVTYIYSGDFSEERKNGKGIFVALLKKDRIELTEVK